MKKVFEMYIRFSVAMKILFTKGFIPFELFDGFNFTFEVKNQPKTTNIVNWLESIFSNQNYKKVSDFFVGIRNFYGKLSEERFYEKRIMPSLIFFREEEKKNQQEEIFEIEQGETENSFIIKEIYGNPVNLPKEAEISKKLNFIDVKPYKNPSKIDFLKCTREFLDTDSFFSILFLLDILDYLEDEKNEETKAKFYKSFIEYFCITMNECILEKSKFKIRHIQEFLIEKAITNQKISTETKNRNIFEAVSQVDKFYIALDDTNSFKKDFSTFSKPLVLFDDDENSNFYLTTTLDTIYLENQNFDEEITFTTATPAQIKKLCELSNIEPNLKFIILLPNDLKLCASVQSIKNAIEDGEQTHQKIDENANEPEESNPQNKKLRFCIGICIFLTFIIGITAYYLFRPDFVNCDVNFSDKGLAKYRGNAEELVYEPEDYITVICTSAFSENKTLKTLEIKNGITKIESYAFYNSKIEKLILPNSLTEIKKHAFANLENLTEIEFKTSVYEIKDAFSNCPNLKKITIGKTLYERNKDFLPENADYVFLDDSSTFDPEIYAHYMTLDESFVLYECKIPFETEYFVKEGVEVINYTAFENSKVTKVYLPNSVKKIESCAFYGCNIESIGLDENLEEIDNRAFEDCINLKSIKLPDSLKELGAYAFYGCEFLENVELGKNLKVINSYTFEDCVNLQKITIPENIEEIKERAFFSCASLEEIIIKNKNTKIDKKAFLKCPKAKIIYENEE